MTDSTASHDGTTMIELIDASRRYESGSITVHAVRRVSLTLRAGTVTALVGPSGSGKTTLVNLVIGAELPDEGDVVRRDGLGDGWGDVAFVPQGLGLMHELTISENIGLPGRLGGRAGSAQTGMGQTREGQTREEQTAEELFIALGLDGLGRRFPSDVSLGEQQRAAVARAVIAHPAVLVADEPTAHQDEARAMAVMDQLCGLANAGAAVLIATHEQRILDRVDAIATMVDGHLGPPTDVRESIDSHSGMVRITPER